MACLELQNVSKSYRNGGRTVDVLSHVNLQVSEGEFVAIVGYSGAGKTTLVSLLAGLSAPDGGRALFEGKPMTGPGPERGVVFQNYSLLPWLSAYDNVRLAVDEVHAGWPADRRRKHIEACLEMVSLLNAKDRKPSQLSGGMRQRVALARALALDPRVLLLDEPLSALDALTRGSLQVEIGRMHAEDRKTVVLVTNDVDEAILLADRIIPLSAGPKATLGPAIAVELERPRSHTSLNKSPEFKRIRESVIDYLLGSAGRRRPACMPKTVAATVAAAARVDLMAAELGDA
jgi:nitrate/nitrite transport system ATP-binding protein